MLITRSSDRHGSQEDEYATDRTDEQDRDCRARCRIDRAGRSGSRLGSRDRGRPRRLCQGSSGCQAQAQHAGGQHRDHSGPDHELRGQDGGRAGQAEARRSPARSAARSRCPRARPSRSPSTSRTVAAARSTRPTGSIRHPASCWPRPGGAGPSPDRNGAVHGAAVDVEHPGSRCAQEGPRRQAAAGASGGGALGDPQRAARTSTIFSAAPDGSSVSCRTSPQDQR